MTKARIQTRIFSYTRDPDTDRHEMTGTRKPHFYRYLFMQVSLQQPNQCTHVRRSRFTNNDGQCVTRKGYWIFRRCTILEHPRGTRRLVEYNIRTQYLFVRVTEQRSYVKDHLKEYACFSSLCLWAPCLSYVTLRRYSLRFFFFFYFILASRGIFEEYEM